MYKLESHSVSVVETTSRVSEPQRIDRENTGYKRYEG